jgi:hypothetical protein
MTAQQTLDKILTAKGTHVSIRFKTTKAPAKPKTLNAGILLEKETKGAFKAGISYANLKEVREAIEAGERGPVEAPKGKKWIKYPYTLESLKTGKELVRLYPASGDNQHPSVVYRVNGTEVSKEEFNSYLPPSEVNKTPQPLFDLSVESILDLVEEND